MANFRYIDPDEHTRDPFAAEDNQNTEFEKLLEVDPVNVANKRYNIGESISGTVLQVGAEFLFVDLGGKNAGALAVDEFRSAETLIPKVGDTVQAFVRSDNGSEVILTRTLRRGEADDSMMRNAYENKVPVEAKVEKTTKGGFEASIGGKRAFIPMSQMENGPIAEPESFVGAVLKFHITEYKQNGRNIVLSRRGLLREEQEGKIADLMRTLEVGQTHRATITRFATFGAFADLGGFEGLIPLSEMAWKRVKNAEEVVRAGEVVNVKITKIEHSPRLRVGLSLKDAGEDPWIAHATRLTPGALLDGTVSRLADFGAFVAVQEGVEGLAHVSQLTWEKRIGHPREVLQEGQAVKVHVLTVDLEGRKLSLSIKGPMPEEMAERLKKKKGGSEALSPEEQSAMADWNTYQKTAAVSAVQREDGSIFAAAFTKANTRKNK